MPAPGFDQDLGLFEGVEDLAVDQLIAQLGIEAVSVLPRARAFDVGRFGPDPGDPVLDGLGDELGSLIGPDMLGHAVQDHRKRCFRPTLLGLM